MFLNKKRLFNLCGFLSLASLIGSDSVDTETEVIFSERPISIGDFILCRSCGTEISDSDYLFPKLSPDSQFAFNETLFQKERVLIQILSNSMSYDFPIITSAKSDCEGVGEWNWDQSWFPGYLWKPCICPKCGDHIGWIFDPVERSFESSKPFFGLVLTSVIGENCK